MHIRSFRGSILISIFHLIPPSGQVNMKSIPEVFNQGRCGGCWAFATSEVIDSSHVMVKGKLWDGGAEPPALKPEEMISRTSVVVCNKGGMDDGCQGGNQLRRKSCVRMGGHFHRPTTSFFEKNNAKIKK